MIKISDRICKLAEYYGVSKPSDFAKKTGFSHQVASNYLKGARNPTIEALQVIKQVFDVSGDWLLSGDGEMIKSTEATPITMVSTVIGGKTYDKQLIPIYAIEATAGVISTLGNVREVPEGHILIPNLSKVDGAVYVTGDSMYPILKSGDIVAIQQIHNIDYVIYGNMYLVSFHIDGDDYIVLKYIQKSDQADHIKLVSHNQHHSDFDIPRSAIRALALIKASIRYNSL